MRLVTNNIRRSLGVAQSITSVGTYYFDDSLRGELTPIIDVNIIDKRVRRLFIKNGVWRHGMFQMVRNQIRREYDVKRNIW